MKYLRFKLRTLFILLTLVAGGLWLWRCGQLDASYTAYDLRDFNVSPRPPVTIQRNFRCRVFSYELRVDNVFGTRLQRVVGWWDTRLHKNMDDLWPQDAILRQHDWKSNKLQPLIVEPIWSFSGGPVAL